MNYIYYLYKINLKSFIVICVVITYPSFAHSARSDWVTIEGGRTRLAAFRRDQGGIVHGLLEMQPTTQWMTYWRFPGKMGAPPSITTSNGWILDKIEFPAPKRFYNGNIEKFGYDTSVALPVTFHRNDKDSSAPLITHIAVDFCREQCAPLKADFTLELDKDENANNAEANVLYNARIFLPQKPSDDFRLKQLERTGKELVLTFTLPTTANHAEIFFISPKGEVFWREFKDKQVISLILGDQETKGEWLLTVKVGARAMEMPLILD